MKKIRFFRRFLERQKNKDYLTAFRKDAGFTLLEVIISLTVILVGLVGALSLISFTISSASISSSKLTAVFLAKEGIELIRNVRDTNWLEGAPQWNTGINGIGGGGPNRRAGRIDYNDNSSSALTNSNAYNPPPADAKDCGLTQQECRLYLDANGFYAHDNPLIPGLSSPTPFYRLIILDGAPGPKLKIISQVKWTERGRNYKIELVSYLYNWKQP